MILKFKKKLDVSTESQGFRTTLCVAGDLDDLAHLEHPYLPVPESVPDPAFVAGKQGRRSGPQFVVWPDDGGVFESAACPGFYQVDKASLGSGGRLSDVPVMGVFDLTLSVWVWVVDRVIFCGGDRIGSPPSLDVVVMPCFRFGYINHWIGGEKVDIKRIV